MAWPDDRELPVEVQAAFGADLTADSGTWSWTDLSPRLRATPIQVRVPSAQMSPGTCSVTLDNDDGALTPLHPMSPYWPNVQRGTPLRVSIRRAEDAFSRTSADGWGTADSGQTWSGFGGGGTVLSSDFTISGGKARQSVPVTGAYRVSWLPGLSLRDCRVRLSGVLLPFSDVTGASVEPGNILLRAQSTSLFYLARVEITTAEQVLCKLFNPAGTQLASVTVAGLTHSAGQTLEVVAEIVGSSLRMKVWATGAAEPSGWAVTATDSSLSLPGGVGVRTGVAGGNTNTLPVVASYDSITVYADRFSGFADQWEPTIVPAAGGKSVSAVRVTASGILRRLGQGAPTVLSPWRRMVTSKALSGLLAYWPCEDDVSATRAASGAPGGAAMTASSAVRFAELTNTFFANSSGVSLGFGPSLLPGTAGGAQVANVDQGTLTGIVPAGVSSPIRWSVCWMARPVTSGATYPMVRWDTPGGSITQWEYRHANVSTQSGLWGKRASDGVFVQYASLFDDSPTLREYRVEAWQDSPTGVGVRLWVDGVSILNGFFVDTLARVTQVTVNPTAANVDALAVAHIQVWDTENPPRLGVQGMTSTAQPTDSYGVKVYPHQRWINEAAHLRLARLCAEDGVGVDIPQVDAAFAARMGQQPDGARLDLYRECADADMGVLYERGFRLSYIPRGARYNKPVDLSVDLATYCVTGGGSADVLTPVFDDQDVRNELTVSRADGSSVVVADAASQARNGIYGNSIELNLAGDTQLPDQASWRLNTVKAELLREAEFPLDLAANPDLIDGWLSCGIGSRILRTNPPSQYGPGRLDRLVEGWSETIGPRSWRVQVTPSPAPPWDVATADGEARVAGSGSTLAADLTSGGMSLLLASTSANGPWTEDPTDMPLDVRVGGERVTVSAAAPALLDTFTRSVSSGWGSPWTIGGASAGQFLANGSVGLMGLNVTNTTFTATASGYGADYDVTVRFTPMAVAAGAQFEQMLRVRNGGGISYYESKAQYQTSGQVDFYLQRGTTVLSAVGSAMAYSSTTVVAVRMQVIGSTVRHKIWNASGAEPAAWTASVTDTAVPGSSTDGIQLAARRIAGNTQNGLAVGFDNVTALIPQSLTVSARGVNGVQRAWPARTEVDVWALAVIAL